MRVEGADRVKAALERQARRHPAKASAIVGYAGVGYALYVHENLEARHKPGKQAKYLEGPARRLRNDGTLGRTVTDAMKQGVGMGKALLLACERIQRESQEVVPVALGNLKGSAFAKEE